MNIHFLCPNGHHLVAEPDRAGAPGACPQCRVTFEVPTLEIPEVATVEATHTADGQTAPTGELSDGPVGSASSRAAIGNDGEGPVGGQAGGGAAADVMVVRCPNGHQLRCPTTAKSGTCPKCRATVQVRERRQEVTMPLYADDTNKPEQPAVSGGAAACWEQLLVHCLVDQQAGTGVRLALSDGEQLQVESYSPEWSNQHFAGGGRFARGPARWSRWRGRVFCGAMWPK